MQVGVASSDQNRARFDALEPEEFFPQNYVASVTLSVYRTLNSSNSQA